MSWLGGWEGYRVETVQRRNGTCPEIWIYLGRQPGGPMVCDGCGQTVESVHDVATRLVRDLPILEARTWLSVPRRRVACPRCGPKLERLVWLDRHARVTRRLGDSVVWLCAVLPIKQVAAFFGLHWEAVRPFFELLGPDGCRRIKAVVMDMSAAYANELRVHCPQAEVVYDLFHVVARYGHDVIDRVRVDEANRLRHDKAARKVVKTARWLLLRNRDAIKRPQDHAASTNCWRRIRR